MNAGHDGDVSPWGEMARLVMHELADGAQERAEIKTKLAELDKRFAVLQVRVAAITSGIVLVGVPIVLWLLKNVRIP